MGIYVDCFRKLSYRGRLDFHPWFHVEKREVKYRGFGGRLNAEFSGYDDLFVGMAAARASAEDVFDGAKWMTIVGRDNALKAFRRHISDKRISGNIEQRGAAVKVDMVLDEHVCLENVPMLAWTNRFKRLLRMLRQNKRFAGYVELLEAEKLVGDLEQKNAAAAGLEKNETRLEWLACVGNLSAACKDLDASFKKILRKLNGLASTPGLHCKQFLSAIKRKINELMTHSD
jgi:hypothetical protein